MKSKNKLVLAIFLLNFFIFNYEVKAQPTIEWERNYGGSKNDKANSIMQTTDGGYIVAGSSNSKNKDVGGNNGKSDYWILKLDGIGNLEWEKNYGGSEDDIAWSIMQTTDGGYIVTGNTFSNDGNVGGNNGESDCWVIKLDEKGDLEWENNYGGSKYDISYSILQTVDGGYIFSGNSLPNDDDAEGNNAIRYCWIVKLDRNGTIEWEENYEGAWTGSSIRQTSDNGFIVADNIILKLDNEGNLVWKNNESDTLSFRSIQQTNCGGYIAAGGGFYNSKIAYQLGVIKLDKLGKLEWEKNYGGYKSEGAYSIQQTIDSGYIVAGFINLNGRDRRRIGDRKYDLLILKLDNTGNLEWEKNYGGSKDDGARSIIQTKDGGYIVAGYTSSNNGDVGGKCRKADYWIVKLSPH